MKKLLTLLVFVLFTVLAHAGDPAFYGNLLVALEEENPRIRAGMLVSVLENSSAEKCDKNVLQILFEDFNKNNAYDEILLDRLVTLWQKKPSDLNLGNFCLDAASRYAYRSPKLHQAAEAALKTAVPDGNNDNYFYIILYFCNSKYTEAGNQAESIKLFDNADDQWRKDPTFLFMDAENSIYWGFMANDSAPGMQNFDQIPADDPWKQRLKRIEAQLRQITNVSDVYDAGNLVQACIILNMPEAVELFKKYSKASYPTDLIWQDISLYLATRYKQRNLYIPHTIGNNDVINYMLMKDFPRAKRMIKKYDKQTRDQLNIIRKTLLKQYNSAVKIYTDNRMSALDLFPYALNCVLHSAMICKNKEVVSAIVNEIYSALGSKEISADTCNSAGYTAAELDIELDKAVKLISLALKDSPRQSAYLDSLAWAFYRKKKFHNAEQAIDNALRFRTPDPGVAALFLHAAAIKVELKKFDEAKTLLNRAKFLYDPNALEFNEYSIELQQQLENILK